MLVNMLNKGMKAFATKEELVQSYKNKLNLCGMSSDCAAMVATEEAVYVPHKYRGGFVVRNFGFSIERIGKYVNLADAGNPEDV